MSVYFIGCLHLGHRNLIENLRGMEVEEHDELLMDNLKSLTKRDKLFILGDISMENSQPYYRLVQLSCVTHVVLGNHDRHQDAKYLANAVDQVSGCLNYKHSILTHIPVHPMCLDERYKINIHAHIHAYNVRTFNHMDQSIPDPQYINVDAHKLNYKPISWEEIIS